MKALRVTTEEVVEALKESSVEIKKEDDGKVFVRRAENAPLPKLEASAKSGLGPRNPNKKKNNNVFDGGVLFTLKGIPEEQTLFNVKEAVKGKLPEGTGCWCSSVSEQNTCVLSCAPFDKDVELVENMVISVGGVDLKPILCYGEALQQALKILPKAHKEAREKRAKTRQKQRQRPILVGDQKFVNMNSLRGKVKETLTARSDGEQLKVGGPDYKLITALMAYHPNKDKKMKDMIGLKVDQSMHAGSRCFWVLREGADPEDFSMRKCMDLLEENPPYADAPKPAEAAATGSPSKPAASTDAPNVEASKEAAPAVDAK